MSRRPQGARTLARIGRLGRFGRFGRFGTVGLSGLAVNAAAMALLDAMGVPYLLAALLATQVSSTWNFIGSEWWAFRGRGDGRRIRRYVVFLALNVVAFVIRSPMIWILTELGGLHPVVSNVLSLCAMTLARFVVADSVIWSVHADPRRAGTVPAAET